MLPSLSRWSTATLLGWLLGVPLIALLAAAGEAVHIESAQSLVGAGMGVGVGLCQAHALREVLGARWRWVLATTIALAVPFVGYDIAKVRAWDITYSLQWAVMIGGPLVGVVQSRLLARRFGGTWWWIPASALGWSLSVALVNALDRFGRSLDVSGLVKLAVFAGGVILGGLVLGLSTGAVLRRLRG